jgi:hypothetical protein
MRLNQLLQICVLMLLLIPLVGLSPTGMVQTGYRATLADLGDLLGDLDRSGKLGDGGRRLLALLSPSPNALAFTQANVDRNIRTAEKGYRLLRRVTGDAFMKNLVIRPGQAVDRLVDGIAQEASKASLYNLKRAFDDPLRLPPALQRLLRG